MYPPEILDYIENNLPKDRFYMNNKSGLSSAFIEFREFCKIHNIFIDKIFSENTSFMEIVYCIKQGTGPMLCECGNIVQKSFQGRRYCCIRCRSNNKKYCKSISDIKSALYNDKEWKKTTENKKVATTVEHYGVSYPMQNVVIFEKQQAACFKKDENGLHGYEPNVYPFLRQLYPDILNGTKYLKDNKIEIKWIGDDGKYHHSYPDFFCESINSFIEVKSDYTRKEHDYKIMKCKDELYNMGYGYYICTVKPKKSFYFETYNHRYTDKD